MKIRITQPQLEGVTFEINPVRHVSEPQLLDWLFRQFNCVDGGELISILALPMRSVSVGDMVEIEHNGRTRCYRCAMVGWETL